MIDYLKRTAAVVGIAGMTSGCADWFPERKVDPNEPKREDYSLVDRFSIGDREFGLLYENNTVSALIDRRSKVCFIRRRESTCPEGIPKLPMNIGIEKFAVDMAMIGNAFLTNVDFVVYHDLIREGGQ